MPPAAAGRRKLGDAVDRSRERRGRCPAAGFGPLQRPGAIFAQRRIAMLALNNRREERAMNAEEATKAHAADLAHAGFCGPETLMGLALSRSSCCNAAAVLSWGRRSLEKIGTVGFA